VHLYNKPVMVISIEDGIARAQHEVYRE